MNKRSGQAGSAVEPIAPQSPHEADNADPGEVDKMKAEQIKTQSGKYGSTKVKPFQPDGAGNGGNGAAGNAPGAASVGENGTSEKRRTWIEIELVGEDDQPIAGERYRITLPTGEVAEGTLDAQGWARAGGFDAGQCKIAFPELDEEAWEFIKSLGPKAEES
jgi:hypothetical protein